MVGQVVFGKGSRVDEVARMRQHHIGHGTLHAVDEVLAGLGLARLRIACLHGQHMMDRSVGALTDGMDGRAAVDAVF